MLTLLLAPALLAAPATPPKPALNTVCPVLGESVDPQSPTVVIKGRAYRVCCPPCKDKLRASPATFLEADGVPKNQHLESAAKPQVQVQAPQPPPVPRSQAPKFLPPQVEALLVTQPKSPEDNRLRQVWMAPGYDRALGLGAAELQYLPEAKQPAVTAAWQDLVSPKLHPASPYRLEAAVTWMEPAQKVKASGLTFLRMGTLCVEGLVKDASGATVAAFRTETLFGADQKVLLPTRLAVANILAQITATLPL